VLLLLKEQTSPPLPSPELSSSSVSSRSISGGVI
jgi:hypothetical protein